MTTRTDKEWMVAERMNGELILSDEVELRSGTLKVVSRDVIAAEC